MSRGMADGGAYAVCAVAVLLVAVCAVVTTTAVTATVVSAQPAHAQEEDAAHKSITIRMGTGDDGLGMHVTHILGPSGEPATLRLIDAGTILGGSITVSAADAEGGATPSPTTISAVDGTATIPPSEDDIAVSYEITGAIDLTGDIYALEFSHPRTTVFVMPEDAGAIFVNGRLVELEGKRGFACHGCAMTLEYSTSEPSSVTESVEIRDYMTFTVEIVSHNAGVGGFGFDETAGRITFQTDGAGPQFVTVNIPTDLMHKPFAMALDGQRTTFEGSGNETHTSIVARLGSGGDVAVAGTLAQHIRMQQELQLARHSDAPQEDDSIWVVAALAAGLAAVAAAVAILITKRRFSRHESRTNRTRTRQSGSGIPGISLHIRPPTAPFQRV